MPGAQCKWQTATDAVPTLTCGDDDDGDDEDDDNDGDDDGDDVDDGDDDDDDDNDKLQQMLPPLSLVGMTESRGETRGWLGILPFKHL